MKKCYYCGVELDDDADFCTECGSELPNCTCPRCGADVDEHDNFCQNCGYDLLNDEGVEVEDESDDGDIPEENEEKPSFIKQYLPYIVGGLFVLALVIGYFVWDNSKGEEKNQQIVVDSLSTDSISDKVELSPQEIILERVKFIYEDAYKQASNGDSYWLTTELNSLIKENEEVTPAGEIGCIDYDIWSQSQGGDGSPSFNVKSAELLSENKAIAKIAIKYSEGESYSKDVKLVLIRESNDWLIDDFITDYEGKEYSFKNDLIECIKSTKESQNEEIADAAADTIPEVTEY